MSTRMPAISYARGASEEIAQGFRSQLGTPLTPSDVIHDLFGLYIDVHGGTLNNSYTARRAGAVMLRNFQPIYGRREDFGDCYKDPKAYEQRRRAHAFLPFSGMYARHERYASKSTFLLAAYAGAMRMDARTLEVTLRASELAPLLVDGEIPKPVHDGRLVGDSVWMAEDSVDMTILDRMRRDLGVDSDDVMRARNRGRTDVEREAFTFARAICSGVYSRGLAYEPLAKLINPLYASMALHFAIERVALNARVPFDVSDMDWVNRHSEKDRDVLYAWHRLVSNALTLRKIRTPLGLFIAFSGYDYATEEARISAPDTNRPYESALLGSQEVVSVYGEGGRRSTKRTSMALSTWVGKIAQLIRKYEDKENEDVCRYARWLVLANTHGLLDKYLWVSEPKMGMDIIHGDAVIEPYKRLSESSCMRKNPHECLTLYSRNPQSVVLAVFTRDTGGQKEQVGRALLWRVTDGNGKEHVYMDRIYDRQNVPGIDTRILRSWAIERMRRDEMVVTWPTDGKEFVVHVQLEDNSFENRYYHVKDGRQANKNVCTIVTMHNETPFPYMDNMRGIVHVSSQNDTITYELSPMRSGRGAILQTANHSHMNYCMDPRRAFGEDWGDYVGVSDLSEDGDYDDEDAGTVWSEFHGERIDEDDAAWSESLQSHVDTNSSLIEYSSYHDDYISNEDDNYVRITAGSYSGTLVYSNDAVWCEDTGDWTLEGNATDYLDVDDCTQWTIDGSVIEDHEGVSRLESECTVCEDEDGNDVYVLTHRVEDYKTHIAISNVEESEEA